ncbi:MAG: DnaA/Hda family protein, partial [Thermodesulfobacteriota bacterium]|nr:DnaA/Hda family protein [Thermodesulfobacteriota bacterium]
MNALFEEVMSKMEGVVGPAEFRRWLLPLRGHVRTDEALTIQVPNIFFKTWLTDHYLQAMEKAASEVSGRELKINFVCSRSEKNKNQPVKAGNELGPGGEAEGSVPALINQGLNEQYRFANFIVGNSNQLAYAASRAVANLSPSYNPLFIYGGSGLGKTHLLNAIGN